MLILVVLEADSKEMTKGGWQLVEFFEGYDKSKKHNLVEYG